VAITKIKVLPDDVVTSAKVEEDTLVNADVVACAAIAQSKISGLTTSLSNLCTSASSASSTVTSLCGQNNTNLFNIALLGFKMAVNENLTVFNLIDGIVDEFHDESGTDEAEGSNDTYNASDDYYINSTQPDGQSLAYSAGFGVASITEPGTSAASTNPAQGAAGSGTFTVPTGVTSVNITAMGAGGGFKGHAQHGPGGAGGGLATGTLAVTGGQALHVGIGEGGNGPNAADERGGANGGGNGNSGNHGGGGGGLSGIFSAEYDVNGPNVAGYPEAITAPEVYLIAGAGGGSSNSGGAGAGGGQVGLTPGGEAQTARDSTCNTLNGQAGGGDQEQGGQGGIGSSGPNAGANGAFLYGGQAGQYGGGGGSGYYGGGGGAGGTDSSYYAGGGGGSSYYGHPQITSGATEAGADNESGAVANPLYAEGVGEGWDNTPQGTSNPVGGNGEDGYVFITASLSASATSTTIISSAFAAGSVPTTSRIVVFEEHVDTPTLNTDIIASISRNGGSNFTTATLTDSGYVTGASGQRILTGQATISGQPSGQSMRWKLALANNQVKIHGVSLSWA